VIIGYGILILQGSRPDKYIPITGWISIFKVSTMWNCYELRAVAIKKINFKIQKNPPTTKLDPIKLVSLGREYFVDSWVLRGFETLVNREKRMSETDAHAIGMLETFRIMSLREERYRRKASSGSDSEDSDSLILSGDVQTAFQTELESIAEKAEAFHRSPECD